MPLENFRFFSKEWAVFALCLVVLVAFYFSLGVTGPLFLIAWFLAYLSFPIVRLLEGRSMSRAGAVAVTISFVVLLLLAVAAILGPWVYREIKQLIQELPGMIEWMSDRINEFSVWISGRLNIEAQEFEFNFQEAWLVRLQEMQISDLQTVRPFLTSGLGFILYLVQLALLPIFYIYLLLHFDRIPTLIERMIPAQILPHYQRYAAKFDSLILGYIQGLFLVCCFLAFSYALGLSLSGVRFGLVVGIVAGFLSFIPYLGFFAGITVSTLLILIYGQGFWIWIGFALTFGIAQLIESYYLTPRLVGSRVGLHPLAVILLVIAGANVAGLAGMIIAIPLGAMLWIVLDDLLVEKQRREGGELPD
ncbi:MAG: AI-2E family transporter [Bradymonadales bacterium]|nr:MAG: AI-2E family transporter [Bradymonadales bacterium]